MKAHLQKESLRKIIGYYELSVKQINKARIKASKWEIFIRSMGKNV
jgi:hypothetical protein